jgi:hypothetical protein
VRKIVPSIPTPFLSVLLRDLIQRCGRKDMDNDNRTEMTPEEVICLVYALLPEEEIEKMSERLLNKFIEDPLNKRNADENEEEKP